MLLGGEDVTEAIRTLAITTVTHYAANNADVREHLVRLQRRAAGTDNIVTEGRDQGTVVFPGAEGKIFLTASPAERARRRLRDLQGRGEKLTFEEVLAKQNERDERDVNREVGPLMPARDDAIEVRTDGSGSRSRWSISSKPWFGPKWEAAVWGTAHGTGMGFQGSGS